MSISTSKGISDAVVPVIDVLSLIQDDLGFWVGSDHFRREDRRSRIRDGNGIANKQVKVSCRYVVLTVQRPEPSKMTIRVWVNIRPRCRITGVV